VKLSFWTLGTPGWSNEAVVEAAERFGFDGVDLRCAGNGNVSLQSSDAEIRALKAQFAEHHVEIASLLGYNLRGGEKGVDWDAVVDDLVAHAELCNRLGVTNLRANVGAPAADSTWDAYLEGFAAAIERTLAQTHDVVINVQNHPGSITMARAAQLAENVGSERFGIGFSPEHCVDMGEDPVAEALRVGRWVRHVHLADRETASGPQTEGKYRASLPGAGIVQNAAVLDNLRKQGFDGWVSLKWEKPTWPDLPDAEVALPAFVSFMSALPVAR
jgi:sugar phosphate isomerase/epimerase